MKTKLSKLILSFMLLFCCNIFAQDKDVTFQFKMWIERGKLALESEKGNNWIALNIQKKNFTLNQNGMLWKDNNKAETADSRYIIDVEQKGNQVILTGIKGTNWKTLTLKLPNKGNYIAVNNFGKVI